VVLFWRGRHGSVRARSSGGVEGFENGKRKCQEEVEMFKFEFTAYVGCVPKE
jgi:hypothetical protein